MPRKVLLATMLFCAAIPAAHLPADSPSELLEKAIFTEETKGDLDQAILIYKQILSDAKANRAYVAKAQFRLGQCLLKKGRKNDAVTAFEKLIADFPDQKALVSQARKHLPASSLGALDLTPAPWKSGETLQLRFVTPADVEIGTAIYMTDEAKLGDRPIWQMRSTNFVANRQSSSRVAADRNTFMPIEGWWHLSVFGTASTKFSSDKVIVKLTGKDEKSIDLNEVVYDNEQGVNVFRRLPMKVGKTLKMNVFSAFGAAVVPLEIEVAAKEQVKVPAGDFEAYRLELNIGQTFWVSTDEHRYLVKYEAGGIAAELTEVRQRKKDGNLVFKDEKHNVTIVAPDDWTYWQRNNDADNKVHLLDPQGQFRSEFKIATREDLELDDKATPRSWVEREIEGDLSSVYKNLKVRETGWKKFTIDGQPAIRVIADMDVDKKQKCLYGVAILGDRLGTHIAFVCDRDDLESAQAVFDKIVSSYRVLP